MPRLWSVLLLLLLSVIPAAAQQPWVDPRLRILELRTPPVAGDPADEPGEVARGEHPGRSRLRAPILLQRSRDGEARVPLLVELRTLGALQEIRGLGG